MDLDQAPRERTGRTVNALRSALAAALVAGIVPACIGSSVLAVSDRAVRPELAEREWRAATPADLPGLWRTVAIEGDVAAVVLDVTYWIADDGSFSGAALFAGPPPSYQVLSGVWHLEDDELVLGDGDPARAEISAGGLRLTGPQGRLVLERAEIR